VETLQNFLAFPLLCKWLMTLLTSHLLPAASALNPYPLCTGLCSSFFYSPLTPLVWWDSYSLFWSYFKS